MTTPTAGSAFGAIGNALIVDPSVRERESLAGSFPANWRVQQCADLETARTILSATKMDLLVVELQIDGGTGFDVAALATGCQPACALALVSEQLSVAAAVRAFDMKFSAIAPKPTTAANLLGLPEDKPNGTSVAPRMTLERAGWEYIWRYVLNAATKKEAAQQLGVQARSLRRMLERTAPNR